MRSLRSRLWLLWVLALAASLVVSYLLYELYETSITAQEQRAEAVVARACESIRAQYGFYVAGWNGGGSSPTAADFRRDVTDAVLLALRGHADVEGGVWSATVGSIAYAFPTYAGTSRKTDLPDAERTNIQSVNLQAERADRPVSKTWGAEQRGLILTACPLGGPYPRLTGWAMTRVQGAPGYDRLRIGLAVAAALVLVMAGWLTWTTRVWDRHVHTIETTLAARVDGSLPALAPTGERELDRLVSALNDAGARLAQSQSHAEEMARRVADAERLATLGRVVAGVAHEIRNPLAAMRLKVENALAGDDRRRRNALEASLPQIARLDRLVDELLTITHPRTPRLEVLELQRWLAEQAEDSREQARGRGINLETCGEAVTAAIDPEMLGRALDNLLLNAIQHTPAGGRIAVSLRAAAETIEIAVANSGAGIAPGLRERLFEPFVTGRADGTGLGLAIARELVQAHGGTVRLTNPGSVAEETVFTLELPWRRS